MTKQALVTQLLALARDALKPVPDKPPTEIGAWYNADYRAGQYAAFIKASNLVRELDADEWTTH
jgi:hypothetical protein